MKVFAFLCLQHTQMFESPGDAASPNLSAPNCPSYASRHTQAYKRCCFSPGSMVLACAQHRERGGGVSLFYTHVYTFYTLIFSDAKTLQASGCNLLYEGCYEECCFAATALWLHQRHFKRQCPSAIRFRMCDSPAGSGMCFWGKKGSLSPLSSGEGCCAEPHATPLPLQVKDHLGFRHRKAPLSLPRDLIPGMRNNTEWGGFTWHLRAEVGVRVLQLADSCNSLCLERLEET